MIKKLTEELIQENLEERGAAVPHETHFEDKLKKVLEVNEATITHQWTDNYDIYFYTEETVDGYVIHVVSENPQGQICLGEDVYYYEEGWFEKLRDYITEGSSIYIEPSYEDSYALEEIITELYEEWYMEEYEEVERALIDDGYEYE